MEVIHKHITTFGMDFILKPCFVLLFAGLFEYSHLNYENERRSDEPSIGDMVESAIRVMQHHPQGFFLLVEGILSF